MNNETDKNSEIFPESSMKTYGLMGLVKGKSLQTEKEPEDTVFTYPNLIIKEIIFFMILTGVIVAISLIFDAPLEELANPSKTPNPAKAPWYFLGLQELLHYFSPIVAGVVIPGAVVTALFILPYIDTKREGIGIWFAPERKMMTTIFAIFIFIVVVLTIIGSLFRGPSWMWVWPWENISGH